MEPQHDRTARILTLTLFAIIASISGFAQAPTGHFGYPFTNLPLWDISGTYQRTESGDTVTVTFSHSANGKLVGSRAEVYDNNGDHIEGTAFITGQVTSTPFSVGLRDRWKGTLNGTVGGQTFLANATAHGTGVIVPNPPSMQLDGSVRVCVVHGRCVSSRQGHQTPLPAGMTGQWVLEIDVTANGNRLAGAAAVTLSNLRKFDYGLTGTYNPRKGSATLRLKGYGDAAGTYLLIATQGTDLTITGLRGRILGQVLKLP